MTSTSSRLGAIPASRRHSLLSFLALAAVTVQAGAGEGDVTAVLKLRELSFVYRPNTPVRSCDAIERRVASVLHMLGAREELDVRASGCEPIVGSGIEKSTSTWGGRPDRWEWPHDPWDKMEDPWEDRWDSSVEQLQRRRAGSLQAIQVRIRAMMPVELTPQVLAEVKRETSRRELVARVRGDRSAAAAEPIVFPAERRTVTLSRQTLGLHPSECELLEQMSRSVFEELDARVIQRGSCGDDVALNIPPRMTVEALLPVLPQVPTLAPPLQTEPTASPSEHEKQP